MSGTWHSIFVVFLSKTLNHNPIMRKTSANPNEGIFYKMSDQYSSKLSRSSKIR